jgi:hypothetical protein
MATDRGEGGDQDIRQGQKLKDPARTGSACTVNQDHGADQPPKMPSAHGRRWRHPSALNNGCWTAAISAHLKAQAV